jgi:hypothetical protein
MHAARSNGWRKQPQQSFATMGAADSGFASIRCTVTVPTVNSAASAII